jgi:circadian clock protein KaiB
MSTRAHPVYNHAPAPKEWKLRLYVTDWNPRCVQAYRNIKRICQEHVGDKCNIEVVDLLEEPGVARRDQIVAVPTLVKMTPKPQRIMVGDFSKVEQVLKGLDVQPEAHESN